MDTTQCTAPAEVRSFCESVSESTSRTITLLKAIEQTVDWLVWMQNRAKADAKFVDKTTRTIKTCERIKPIDVDGTLCTLIEETENSLHQLYNMLISKREFGHKAPELQGDHKSAIVDEYTNTIGAIADLHNLMTDLRWAIGEHDADLEKPVGAAFSTKEELKAYLSTL